MKILLGLLLFVCSYSATVVVNDINFNQEYSLLTNYGRFIPAGTSLYLRMHIIEKDKMSVSLKTFTSFSTNYFYIRVSFFNVKPTDSEVVNGNWGTKLPYDGDIYVDGIYSTYSFPFDTPENSNYLGVHVYVYQNLEFLNLTVISVTAFMWYLIVIGVFVFIAAVVGGIFGYRKYRH